MRIIRFHVRRPVAGRTASQTHRGHSVGMFNADGMAYGIARRRRPGNESTFQARSWWFIATRNGACPAGAASLLGHCGQLDEVALMLKKAGQ